MKKTLFILIAFMLSVNLTTAQVEEEKTESQQKEKKEIFKRSRDYYEMKTLFGRKRSNGGYGAFWLGYSVIDNMNALQFGGRGSWVIQHSFAIGFGGTGFINEYHYDAILDRDVFLTGGYGGIYLEPVLLPASPVHLAFPVLLGVGGVSFVSYDDVTWGSNFVEDYEAFLIIEPAGEIELNLARFMRIGLGVSYRYPVAFNLGQSPDGAADARKIEGLTYNISFKFGSF